jgi:uncharacterized protein (TIGR02147 family)
MFPKAMLVDYFKKEYHSRLSRNACYSLRSFARSLDIHPGTLSAILNGKRPLTFKAARHLLKTFPISPTEREELLYADFEDAHSTLASEETPIQEDALNMIANWEHYAILSLLRLPRFRANTETIAKRLKVRASCALGALKRLERLGLIKKENGRWKRITKSIRTTTDIPSKALRKAHLQYLHKAIESLNRHAVEQRDISGITMAIDYKRLPQAKKMIQKFRQQLAQFLETDQPDSVYRLNLQLFPLDG